MKLCLKSLAILIIAAITYSIIGCAAPASFTYQNIGIAISAQCSDCQSAQITVTYNPNFPVPSVANGPAPAGSVIVMPNSGQGGVILLTAFVTNAPANVTWQIYPTPNLSQPGNLPTGTSTPVGESGSSVGTISAASGSTAYYTQGGVPVYTGAALVQAQALGIPQGDVLVVASVPSDPNDPTKVATASQLIQLFATGSTQGPPTVYLVPRTPLTPAGITTPAVTVSHLAPNNTFQFYGGAVGASPCNSVTSCTIQGTLYPTNTTDNQVVWEVGPAPFSLSTAIPGGSTTYGTISTTGLYTAPATVPATQPVVVLVSHLISTVNAYAYVSVN